MKRSIFWTLILSLSLVPVAQGQAPKPAGERTGEGRPSAEPEAQTGSARMTQTSPIPRLVKFSGVLLDSDEKPLSRPTEMTFSLYKEEGGGEALWWESQTVEPDAQGRYTVLLGAMNENGLPMELFTHSGAHWLGVQVRNLPDKPRVLLVSVPYALKAADAETLGGKPLSAFVLSESRAQSGSQIGALREATSNQPSTGTVAAGGTTASPSNQTKEVEGSGTKNFIPIWVSSTTLGNSVMFQAGGNVGVGTTNPLATLDVTGSGTNGLRGTTSSTAQFASGVYGQSSSTSGNGVVGEETATSGTNNGVFGRSASPNGVGVSGAATATSGNATGVYGQSASFNGTGVAGYALNTIGFANGVSGGSASSNGTGIFGANNSSNGGNAIRGVAYGTNGFANGVVGESSSPDGNGVIAQNRANSGGNGVRGVADGTNGFANGVVGESSSPDGNGVFGQNRATTGFANGVSGVTASPNGTAVFGVNNANTGGIGVTGESRATSGVTTGVFGSSASSSGSGVNGNANATSGSTYGVFGRSDSTSGTGLFGYASANSGSTVGVVGFVESPNAVAGSFVAHSGAGVLLQGFSGSNNTKVFAVDANGNGFFAGNLNVTGTVSKGGGSFKIDDPLDPANKTLSHSFVESPDMMNIYNGIAKLDAKGEVWVNLPDYFESLNGDFRYQLTAVGAPQPELYVAHEVEGNRFKIEGGKPGAKVSWQVTGVRHDAYANAHRIPVEEDKPSVERGYYLHPDAFSQPQSKSPGSPNSTQPRSSVENDRK